MLETDDDNRISLRNNLKELNKYLAGAAKNAGVHNFEHFQNAGYEGMYHQSSAALKKSRGLKPNSHLLDYMGEWELRAHIKKAQLTISALSLYRIYNNEQEALSVHRWAGESVRKHFLFFKILPEKLPIEDKLHKIKASEQNNIINTTSHTPS